jgi:zinc protease
MRFIFPLLLLSVIYYPSSGFATDVKEVVSKNGIKAWLVEEHALPLVAVKIAFTGSGSAYDPPAQLGRANMTTAMLMEGAGDLDSNAFNAALEDKAIQLNFALDNDTLRASLATISDHKEEAFSYLAMALTKPRFDDTALERVRSQNLSVLLQQEKNPNYLLARKWDAVLFANHPYGNPALGVKDTITALTKEQLSTFTQNYLTRENMIISVVGDITPTELSALLDKHLAALPVRYTPDTKVADTVVPTQATRVVIENDIPQTMVMFGANGIKRSDPDYFAAYVMNYIIGGGGLTSKLINEIREKRGLAYSASSQLDPMTHSALWLGGFATRNEKVGEALTALKTTLKDFSDNGPSDKELTEAKQYITGSFVLSLDSNEDVANYLTSMQMYNLGKDYLDKRNALMQAVSKEQVKRMAEKLTDPDRLLVVMVGKPVLDEHK